MADQEPDGACLTDLPYGNPKPDPDQKLISDYSVDLPSETVLVTGTIPYDDLLEKIKKTGKEVRSGETLE
ncbi:hypothetical protein FRC00_008895 [Tulasnella sp. 408]|nr:hypothetical protein FRC00_008895 [Tulasnella sp. 408]